MEQAYHAAAEILRSCLAECDETDEHWLSQFAQTGLVNREQFSLKKTVPVDMLFDGTVIANCKIMLPDGISAFIVQDGCDPHFRVECCNFFISERKSG